MGDGKVSNVHVRVPVWMGEILKHRMERLRLLNLEGQPLGRSMGEVVRIWAQVLAARMPVADEHMDGPRIHAAFDALERDCERWPQPAHLLRALPARPELHKLPPPPMTAEQKQRARAMLADIVRKMGVKP